MCNFPDKVEGDAVGADMQGLCQGRRQVLSEHRCIEENKKKDE